MKLNELYLEAVKVGDWVKTKPQYKLVAGVVDKIDNGVAFVRPHNTPEKIERIPITNLIGEENKSS